MTEHLSVVHAHSRRVLAAIALSDSRTFVTVDALVKALGHELSVDEVQRAAQRLIVEGLIKARCYAVPIVHQITSYELTAEGRAEIMRDVKPSVSA